MTYIDVMIKDLDPRRERQPGLYRNRIDNKRSTSDHHGLDHCHNSPSCIVYNGIYTQTDSTCCL